MGFNPFAEKGVPIEKQALPWSTLNVMPYQPDTVHPYTRTRGILMNGIEVEAALFYHNWHRHADDMDLRRQIAAVRRVEQQQQKMINWGIPAEETTLEVTIGYEQLAVDLTASMAKNEPDPYVKAALDFALIEDFDHLYRYANQMLKSDPKRAEAIVKNLTEVTPGRPTILEHLHPFDSVRRFVDRNTADPLTLMHILTIIAAEQQTMNYYMNVGNRFADPVARGLYLEIGMIEEQHVTHYGSLADPRATWFEMAVAHEYHECYLYHSCMISEVDDRIKAMWQQCLENEIEHLRLAVMAAKKFEGRDLSEKYPKEFPAPTIIQSSKNYVRNVIASQMQLTGDMDEYAPLSKARSRDRYLKYQGMVNAGEYVPSQKVIADTISDSGSDYRIESEGPHPIDLLRSRDILPSDKELYDYEMSHEMSAAV